MSIELNWEALTAGPDGDALAESIRDFIHTKFQAVPLPRFIKSVTVHEFAFGSTPPDVVLKDICDPLPDFYEENPDADEQDGSDEEEDADEEGPGHGYGENVSGRASTSNSHALPPNRSGDDGVPDHIRAAERRRRAEVSRRLGLGSATFGPGSAPSTPGGMSGPQHIHTAGLRSAPGTPADLGSLLPSELTAALRAGLRAFDRKLAGYTAPEAILTGLETRTSSPVRLVRGEHYECTQLAGLYPCGEGAGYAGGIMSAAVDGLRVASAIVSRYSPAGN